MNKLNCYQQKRVDGGVRTAVTVNEATVLHMFEPGDEDDSDPTLEWYVDVRCKGKRLPTETEEVRRWLLDHASVIQHGLTKLAEQLVVGMDLNDRPLRFPVRPAPRGVEITLVCSATYRAIRLEIGEVLLQVRDRWEQTVKSLPLYVPESLIW